ncbi:hypothetical protein Glove_50g61 [Diversispora epigaea]|uniref:Protein kinase domain-containing protein n=1 Tax=Diversispora epigaea TaxID=1348612 RepID=A0A397JN04_9GLOM|nr:hypothetical protein Glove_50g61 [Diversispora epigaea]
MSFSNNKDLARIAKDRNIQKYVYNKFEDIAPIASGAFGTVNRAYSKDLEKHVALKCLHNTNSNNFYKIFMNELQNYNAVNHHKNIIKFYGVSIDYSTERCYLVLQYAKDNDLRTFLRNNFKNLDWETKIKMAQDITNGLCYMHEANIVHRDLHSKNVLVHEEKLLITDLGLSQPLESNSNSMAGGMFAYSDPEYIRNPIMYKRSKASDIYSLGVLFWELSSGIPPFDNLKSLEILEMVKSGLREAPINGTPEDYIKIYSNAWKDNSKQRPTIEDIRGSLKNIQLENIYNNSNENNENNHYVQIEVYANNQLNKFKPMKSYDRDSMSMMSIESNNQISLGTSISLSNLGITVLGNHGESSTLSLNSSDQEYLNNELKKYGYNVFENLEEIGENVHNATIMNGETKVTLKSIVVNSMELFVNELKKHLKVKPHGNIMKFYGISQKDLNSRNYILVLECSNGETLRNYLKSNFEKLKWSDKLKLAQQIAKAIKHFHSSDIIHGDMNSENILIHNDTIKISNFGISKLVIEPSIDLLNSLGLIEYSDPMLLEAKGKFNRTKASDIYSVGILLWEISSGIIPYDSLESRLQNEKNPKEIKEIIDNAKEAKDESKAKEAKNKIKEKEEFDLISYIIKGNREIPIQGTSQNYVKIYQDCWNQNPDQRPDIEKVIQDLEHVEIIFESIENFKKYRKCKECQQANTGLKWCNSCNSKRFQEEFHKWTSDDKEIDVFIQQIQLMTNNYEEVIEWIPFDRLKNVVYFAKGGFSTIYKALWLDGYIDSWNYKEKNWKRKSQRKYVCLKSLYNSTNKNKFLQEIKTQLKFRGKGVIAIYGITKDPIKNEYMMVMQYARYGTLRKMLNNNFEKLSWIQKTRILYYISNGLANIHEAGLMHCDIHPGNIVNESLTSPYITDFGLCIPVSENDPKKIFGIIPYMAPETLNRGGYTQASDIYTFGMIMLEVFTSYPPYYNIPHDETLVMDICQGLKPEIKCEIPQFLKEIMEKCWNFDPSNRPIAKELETQLKLYTDDHNSEINKQIDKVNEANDSNKNFIQYDPNKMHPKQYNK